MTTNGNFSFRYLHTKFVDNDLSVYVNTLLQWNSTVHDYSININETCILMNRF